MTKPIWRAVLTACLMGAQWSQGASIAVFDAGTPYRDATIELAASSGADSGSPAIPAPAGGSSTGVGIPAVKEAPTVGQPFPPDLQRALVPQADLLRAPETEGVLNSAVLPGPAAIQSNEPYTDLWDHIRDGFALNVSSGPRVTRQVEWFENHPDYVTRLAERSRKYLHFILEEVEKRGMPSEIALLPIVESAFNPTALSPAKASGIWQFMPATGKTYGLNQNWWYDGRRDIVAATNGALDYLEKLHAQFGAWDLALAAYNCGEGGIARAIERNQRAGKPTDYASLTLPEETRNYVPKLLAAREIVGDPAAHGLVLPVIPDAPYFAAVTTDKHIDLAVAARFSGLSESEFLTLNPGFNRPLILAQGTHTILVPIDRAETFQARLNDPTAKLVSWRTQRLRRGESYDTVASRFGMSSEELKRVNGISANRHVAGGGTILVRDALADEGDLDGAAQNSAEAELAPPTETITFSHRVRRGESLASIARRYNVGVTSLRTWNRIPRLQGARLGQLLVMHRTGELGETTATDPGLKEPSKGLGPGKADQPLAEGPFESSLVEVAHRGKVAHKRGRPARHHTAARSAHPGVSPGPAGTHKAAAHSSAASRKSAPGTAKAAAR